MSSRVDNAPPPRKGHAGAIIASVAVALVFVLLLAGGAFWLVTRGDDATKIANDTTSITTVPINGTQESFTDPVGTDQQITPRPRNSPSLSRVESRTVRRGAISVAATAASSSIS